MPYIGNIVQDFSVSTAMLNSDSVTSIKVLDGTLVNADINDSAAIAMSKLALSITNSEVNASAAIAGSKISPDFGSQAITTTGSATIGTDLIHAGDTDTKLSFGDNEITLNTAGSERLELDINETTFNDGGSDTDFRIRTPAQTHMFFVNAGDDQIGIKTSSLQSGAVLTVNGRCHLNTQLTLGSNSTLDAGAEATIYKPATNMLGFATAGANERMRITSNGNVGIGIQSPDTELHVRGTASILKLETTATTGSNYISFDDADEEKAFVGLASSGDDSFSVWLRKSSNLRFATNNTEKVRIDSSGNVGIGTTSPAELLHLQSTANNTKLRLTQSGSTTDAVNGAIHFGNSTDGQLCEIRGYTSGSNNSGYLEFRTTSSGTDVTAMTIATSGSVGIGTASPQTNLHIGASGGDDVNSIRIDGTNNTSGGQTHRFVIENQGDSAKVNFKTSAADDTETTKLTINSINGNVGIGTTNPSSKLNISAASGDAYVKVDTTVNGGLILDVSGTQRGVFANDSAFGGGITDIGIGAKGNMIFRTGTSGYTERMRILSGGGITFNGDTAAANALDDYEEGTWSPSGSWTTITARYTKIGRMVYAGFSLRANTNDGSNVTIGNLPFTSGSTHGHVGGIVWGLCEFNTTDSWLNGSVDDDSTTVTVRRGNATIVTFGSGNNNMNQNAFLRGMVVYQTA